MNLYLFFLGVALLIFMLFDIFYTALGMSGGGKLSKWVGKILWRVFIMRNGGGGILTHIGVAILFAVLSVWILFTWLAVFLIFASNPESILGSFNKIPTNLLQKFYYTGYILSTLGNGEFIPNGYFAQLMTAFSGFTGFLIISFSATYLISVRKAVTLKLQLSKYISALGEDVKSILETGWDGENFNKLEPHFNNLLPIILEHNNNHHAFPILHYFHYSDRDMSFPINFGKLMETVFVLKQLPQKFFIYSLNPIIYSFKDYFHTIDKLLPLSIKPQKSPLKLEKEVIKKFGLESYIKKENRSDNLLTKEREQLAGILHEQGLNWEILYKIPKKS